MARNGVRSGATIAAFVLCAFTHTPAVYGEPAQTRAIDVAASKATFSVSHIWVDRVTGSVPVAGGVVTLAPGSLLPAGANAQLDATRIATGEPDRDAALESSDYFDVARFPTWTFVSTSVTPTGPASFTMDGNLTIHGVTQPVRLYGTVQGDAAHPVYRTHATIDRHSFGMTVTRLDPAIGGTVDVTLEIALR